MNRVIGVLWKKKTADGRSYLSGVLHDISGDVNIAIFTNDRKEQDNQPDYQIVRGDKQKQEGGQRRGNEFGGDDDERPAKKFTKKSVQVEEGEDGQMKPVKFNDDDEEIDVKDIKF